MECSSRLAQRGTLRSVPVGVVSFTSFKSVVSGACRMFLQSNRSQSSVFGVLFELSPRGTSWRCCGMAHCGHWDCYDGTGAIPSRCWARHRRLWMLWPADRSRWLRGTLPALSGALHLFDHDGFACFMVGCAFDSGLAYMAYFRQPEVSIAFLLKVGPVGFHTTLPKGVYMTWWTRLLVQIDCMQLGPSPGLYLLLTGPA